VLRACARRLGVELSEAGTRVAMEFTSRGGSGRGIPLPDRLRLGRSFDRLELARSTGASGEIVDVPLLVPGIERGMGEAEVGGRRIRVEWGTGEAPVAARLEAFDPDALRFPLRLRAWSPGDRMRLGYGTKKIVKLLAEARMPREERHRVAVLVDRDGRVLWVPGLARGVDAVPVPGDGRFYIGVEDAHSA
jgi:tRNA(Ile)-lysidine synthetase-like protein